MLVLIINYSLLTNENPGQILNRVRNQDTKHKSEWSLEPTVEAVWLKGESLHSFPQYLFFAITNAFWKKKKSYTSLDLQDRLKIEF